MGVSTDWQVPDVLSPQGKKVLTLNTSRAYCLLTPTEPGVGEVRPLLAGLAPDRLLKNPVRSIADARAALAGLWLFHDFIAESHTISQDLKSPAGSFWHAIMHRREGDFANAKYWYARCRHHPTLRWIGEAGRAALRGVANVGQLERLVESEWDPDGFVDVVEAIHQRTDDPLYEPAVRLQRAEWRVLFDHCVHSAADGA